MIEGTLPECFSSLVEYWLLRSLTTAAPDLAIGVLFDVSTRIVVRWLVEGAHAVTARRVSFVVSATVAMVKATSVTSLVMQGVIGK